MSTENQTGSDTLSLNINPIEKKQMPRSEDHLWVSDSEDNNLLKPAKIKKILELVIGAAPETLDTLKKLAEAVGNDPAFASNVLARLMTEDERSKLAGIEDDANKYEHPVSHPASMITEDETHRFVSDAEKSDWNGKAEDSDIASAVDALINEAPEALNTLKELAEAVGNDPAFASNVLARLMTEDERNKLAGIEDDANKYEHPVSHPASMIIEDEDRRFVSDAEKTDWNGKAEVSDINAAIDNLVDAAPQTLDTLNELAAALGDDPNFATTITNALAGKAPLSHTHDDRYYTKSRIISSLAGKAPLAHTHDDRYYTKSQINSSLAGISSVPRGIISMWSGSTSTIPSGWVLCNGSSGTPDLRNRFIVGAGSAYGVSATGGSANVTLSIDEMPAHTHEIVHKIDHDVGGGNYTQYVNNQNKGWDQSFHTESAGGGQSHENRPPYYALAFIMKL